MQSRALLHLMHLISPSLPVGGFAYSQGLEYALDSGWLKDQQDLHDWLSGVLKEGMAKVDLPLLKRFRQGYLDDDPIALTYWNHWLRANRESKELLFEDKQLGAALRRLLVSLEQVDADDQQPEKPCYASQFARAGVLCQVPEAELLQGFAWSWLENQVAVACKTLPLGQTAAQKLLLGLMPAIEDAVNTAQQLQDDDLGATLPGVAMASALHETQYSRLFRS
ncbi:MAG: urease accessory protein UreF [Motiliproteus sp.]|nr:urease accessory protein UreF [Motiliproteus sp.]MCW9052823.1 urease accessory protein UreF [Motiliproteus sp.]